jgi:hypothetical protein
MNRTEAAYARELELRKTAGEVAWWEFEGLKFRLADNTFYTPDFAVLMTNGELQMHEVKGFWTDDARVKIKVAAERFPVAFYAVKKSREGWQWEAF